QRGAGLDLLPAAADREAHGVADVLAIEDAVDVERVLHLLAVDADDDVAEDQAAVGVALGRAQAGLGGRRARLDLQDQRALDAEALEDLRVREVDAEGRADDATVLDELRDHAGDGVDRDREADAGRRAGGAVDGGVDADQPARAVEQRAAG